MPDKEPFNPTDVSKTSAVVTFTNLFLSPLYPRLGFTPSLLLITAGLYGLHELGRTKKSDWSSFFSVKPSMGKLEPSEIAQNICVGGSHVFDRVTQKK
jgi:hypothetical protein